MRVRRHVLVALLALTPVVVRAQESGITVGSDAPGAMVETLDGKQVDIADYVKKGPTLLQFWATWCSNCKALEPRINAAIKKYEGKVKFVAVAVSVNQTVDAMGFQTALNACFTIHELNHSHWAQIHDNRYAAALPEDGCDWRTAPKPKVISKSDV